MGVKGRWVEVVGGLFLVARLEFVVADGVALGAGAEGTDAVGEGVCGGVGLDAHAV